MSQRRIQDALLEKYLAEACSPELKAQLVQILSESQADRERLEALRAESAAFLISHPPREGLSRLPTKRRLWALLPLGALATSLGAWLFWSLQTPVETAQGPLYAVKGAPTLSVYLKTPQGSERLLEGSHVALGSELRFELKSPTQGFVALFGKDNSGEVMLYYPADAEFAAPYAPENALLPVALALDSLPGREIFFALYAKEAFSLAEAQKALKNGAPLPKGVEAARFDVLKP